MFLLAPLLFFCLNLAHFSVRKIPVTSLLRAHCVVALSSRFRDLRVRDVHFCGRNAVDDLHWAEANKANCS